MAPSYEMIPDELKEQAVSESQGNAGKTPKQTKSKYKGMAAEEKGEAERRPKNRFARKRAGIPIKKAEVRAIKIGRRKLRREMRARGIKGKEEFELTASSLGLYFDKGKSGLLLWLMSHWLGTLIVGIVAMLGVLFLFSAVQEMRGHFTINLSDGMFKEGFTLSETADFANSTIQLFAVPAEDVPCISINQLPADIDEIDGQHNGTYFAYTYYIRNEGENSVSYDWTLDLNSESESVSNAAWIALFEDGVLHIYAKANVETNEAEALPSLEEEKRGYVNLPIRELAEEDSSLFQVVRQKGRITYWRVVPETFETDLRIASETQSDVAPQEVHKYTVVMWIEGDDPDATNVIVGGNLGIEMNFRLLKESESEGEHETSGSDAGSFGAKVKQAVEGFFNNLAFWKD